MIGEREWQAMVAEAEAAKAEIARLTNRAKIAEAEREIAHRLVKTMIERDQALAAKGGQHE